MGGGNDGHICSVGAADAADGDVFELVVLVVAKLVVKLQNDGTSTIVIRALACHFCPCQPYLHQQI